MKIIPEECKTLQVLTSDNWETLEIPQFEIKRSGYLYAFVSNQTDIPVWFDDIKIEHWDGPLVQETNYYPFGLTFGTVAQFGATKSNRLFNSQHLEQDEWEDGSGLNWYDFLAPRNYDPQTGRWTGPDRLANMYSSWSPYSYCYNNPITYTDPSGDKIKDPWDIWFAPFRAANEAVNWAQARINGNSDYHYDFNYAASGALPNPWSSNNVVTGPGGFPVGPGGEYTAFGDYGMDISNLIVPPGFTDASGKFTSLEKMLDDGWAHRRAREEAAFEKSLAGIWLPAVHIEDLKNNIQGVQADWDRFLAQNNGGAPGDGSNWLSNAGTAIGMGMMWATGYRLPFGAGSHYNNDAVAGAMRNAWQVGVARDAFYSKYKGVSDLSGASYTNHKGVFGLEGLMRAGIDPIEQFIGSYRVDIHAQGDMLRFTLTNNTSFKSFFYGIGPAWNGGPMGNFNQTYIFTEPIRR